MQYSSGSICIDMSGMDKILHINGESDKLSSIIFN
jgi:hypothetical protein